MTPRKRTTKQRQRARKRVIAMGRGRRGSDWRTLIDSVVCSDALALLKRLPDGCVNLIAVDPPFFQVKQDAWDNQWATFDLFLDWLDKHLREFRRVLAPNGSLYLFCATQYAAEVQLATKKHFNVLNNIRWRKPPFSTKAEMFDKDTMRAYFPASESIIFAEQKNVQSVLRQERLRAGVSSNDAAILFPSASGGATGCVRNWELGLNMPTPEQYALLATLYPLPRYNDVIRPFTVTARDPYTDVWDFATVNTYPGKHPCEKPLDMMRHIVRASSRRGDLVLDCFAGSGSTLRAAFMEGRHFIGCDMDAAWARKAQTDAMLPYDLPLFAADARDDAA